MMQRSTLACLSIKILLIVIPTAVNLFRYKHVCTRSVQCTSGLPLHHPFCSSSSISTSSSPSSTSCITYNGRAVMQDCLVAIHQKLYFLPAVASSPAGIGQDIDRQRTGGGAEVKAENSVLNGCPASRYLHAGYFYTWGSPPFE